MLSIQRDMKFFHIHLHSHEHTKRSVKTSPMSIEKHLDGREHKNAKNFSSKSSLQFVSRQRNEENSLQQRRRWNQIFSMLATVFIVIMKIHFHRAYRAITSSAKRKKVFRHFANSARNGAWSETWEYFWKSFEMRDVERNSIRSNLYDVVMWCGRGEYSILWSLLAFSSLRVFFLQK